MADYRISDLSEVTSPAPSAAFEIEQAGVSSRLSLANLLAAEVGTRARNFLRNGDFSIAQRQFSRATLTAKSNNTFGPDRWYLQHNGSDTQFRSWKPGDSTPPVSLNGLTGYGEFKNNSGSACGLAVIQVVPVHETFDLRALDVVAQVRVAVSSGTPTLRLSMYAWTGTAGDSAAKQVVASWSSNVPTFASTNHTLIDDTTAALSTSFTALDLMGSVPTGATHIVVVYTLALAAGASLYLGEAGLFRGTIARTWQPSQNEWLDCQPWCWGMNEDLGTNPTVGHGLVVTVGGGIIAAEVFLNTPVPLHKTPSLTFDTTLFSLYDFKRSVAGALHTVANLATGLASPRGVMLNVTASTGTFGSLAVGDPVRIRAQNSVNAFFYLDAED